MFYLTELYPSGPGGIRTLVQISRCLEALSRLCLGQLSLLTTYDQPVETGQALVLQF